MVADMVAHMEMHMVANMDMDKVANKVAEMVADMVADGKKLFFADILLHSVADMVDDMSISEFTCW